MEQIGRELNEKDLRRAKNIAYRSLSLRPRSRAEVVRKLKEKGFSELLVDAVLQDLDRFGYVNDREFALQWTRSRIRLRGFGRRRIEQELREKGISREYIAEALSASFEDSSEFDLAVREAEKKLKTLARFGPDVRRRRLAGLLERKGFPSSVIRDVINGIPLS